MIVRPIALLAALLSALSLGAGASTAVAGGWHSEQPLTRGSQVPASLGTIYDIAFWAPNRGLLLTADGLWAYDGTGWNAYATVCGGVNGRIVWAGPTEFWTINDQPAGQPNPTRASRSALSLCHFVNGTVVASYAQPLGQAASYRAMSGGACLAPDDCWFGGERIVGGANTGAFHLHWDGAHLTPWPSLTTRDPSVLDPDRAVADVAVHQGTFYESVRVDDNPVANEQDSQPFLLHEIQPGTPPAFTPQFATPAPDYGSARPQDYGGVMLSSDGDTLWAVLGPRDPSLHPARPIVLRRGASGLTALTLNDPPDPAGPQLLGPGSLIDSVAAEPGTDSAWIALGGSGDDPSESARLVRVHGNGTVDDAQTLPADADGIARKGPAFRVACPAQGQCWMATRRGWLFHLGDSLPRDGEPAMHRLVTYRPSDASTPIVSPDTLPDDDSGIAPPVFDVPPPEPYTPPSAPARTKAKKLVTKVSRRVVERTTLRVTFTLTAKARVQLLAKRKKTVVARTKRRTLGKGRHTLTLKLNRRRWPTALDLRAELFEQRSGDAPQAGDGVDSDEADDKPDAGPVTISSVRRGAR